MDEDLYAPLFPNGSELDVDRSFDDYAHGPLRGCELSVDGEAFVEADAAGTGSFDRWELGDLSLDDAENVPGDHEALVWPGVAKAIAPCTVQGPSGEPSIREPRVIVEAEHPGDDAESVEALSRLIQPFLAGALEMTPCQGHGAG
ncbi:hypothetical protein [Streptomyces radicis]|uniref:Uncharacterized protein n=1 Tax=Streptomyces radicis TaxID=1750517 RepID=A0A3A9WI13_9ACTN|nr:hypothetical protein [Streptomyces radicis]RKN11953.1 hypothetical protein D7319_03315 [Streptomyces radicis]RKN25996.1 hypothetical protein D7318_07165 [Streptomyces radicis]